MIFEVVFVNSQTQVLDFRFLHTLLVLLYLDLLLRDLTHCDRSTTNKPSIQSCKIRFAVFFLQAFIQTELIILEIRIIEFNDELQNDPQLNQSQSFHF